MAMNEEQPENEDEDIAVSGRMLTVLLVGIAIIIVGVILLVVASVLVGGSGRVGGVIFIGPFPIVFGAGPDATWLIVVGLVIAFVMLVLFFVYRKRSWKVEV
jgi:uncharacterized membrane protein